jgi:hypothetical protein
VTTMYPDSLANRMANNAAVVDPAYTRIVLFVGVELFDPGQGTSSLVYRACIAVTADIPYVAAF